METNVIFESIYAFQISQTATGNDRFSRIRRRRRRKGKKSFEQKRPAQAVTLLTLEALNLIEIALGGLRCS